MSESEVKEDDNETEHNSTAAPSRSEPKKKRKKRKKRSGKQGTHRSSEDNADVGFAFNLILVYFCHTQRTKIDLPSTFKGSVCIGCFLKWFSSCILL